MKRQSSQTNHGIPSSRNTELHHYPALFLAQQKYCLEGDSDPIFPSYHHSSPTAELHISVRKLPRRKTSSMKSQLQLQILYQDNLYGIRIHSPRNGYQVQCKKNFREPHSYSIISQDTTAMYRRNRNHLKPPQVPDIPASTITTVPQEDTLNDEQATFTPQTNDDIQPNEETCTTVQHVSSRSTKGILPICYRIEQ